MVQPNFETVVIFFNINDPMNTTSSFCIKRLHSALLKNLPKKGENLASAIITLAMYGAYFCVIIDLYLLEQLRLYKVSLLFSKYLPFTNVSFKKSPVKGVS